MPQVNSGPTWIKLGTLTTDRDGAHSSIELVGSKGFNPELAYDKELLCQHLLPLVTNTGIAIIGGTDFRAKAYATCSGLTSGINNMRITQTGYTSYDFLFEFGSLSGKPLVVVKTAGTWVSSMQRTTVPATNYYNVPIYLNSPNAANKQDVLTAAYRLEPSYIGDGTVSYSGFSHLNGVTSNIQSQINTINAASGAITVVSPSGVNLVENSKSYPLVAGSGIVLTQQVSGGYQTRVAVSTDLSTTVRKYVGVSTPSASGDDWLIIGNVINSGTWQQTIIEVFGSSNNVLSVVTFNTWQLKIYFTNSDSVAGNYSSMVNNSPFYGKAYARLTSSGGTNAVALRVRQTTTIIPGTYAYIFMVNFTVIPMEKPMCSVTWVRGLHPCTT